MRTTTPIGTALMMTALMLGWSQTRARADDARGEPPQQGAEVQQDKQRPQSVRVILPAPWQPIAPARPTTAQPQSRSN